jgi:hypothetical protein
MAERGGTASDRFIDENLSAYQLTGKSQGSYARGRATAADLVGWATFQKKDYAGARDKLMEAARLSQDQDFLNQFHLGELERAQNAPARARERLSDGAVARRGPAAAPAAATEALAGSAERGRRRRIRRVARDRVDAPPRRAKSRGAQQPRRSTAPEAAAHHCRRPPVRREESAGESALC